MQASVMPANLASENHDANDHDASRLRPMLQALAARSAGGG